MIKTIPMASLFTDEFMQFLLLTIILFDVLVPFAVISFLSPKFGYKLDKQAIGIAVILSGLWVAILNMTTLIQPGKFHLILVFGMPALIYFMLFKRYLQPKDMHTYFKFIVVISVLSALIGNFLEPHAFQLAINLGLPIY